MVLLSSEKFQNYLQIKYKQDFNAVVPEKDLEDLFASLSDYVNITIYIKLLSYIDMIEFENFQRFLFVCIRNHYDEEYSSYDIENIKEDIVLQVLCLICLQYYFL